MAKKPWLKRIVIATLIAELAYVISFNLVLQLPQTRTWINQIKPDKFYITWENVWTLYPFRLHFRNASGHGQSRAQQWEFETQAVSASIDVMPLFSKRIWINHVRLADTRYYQRPRLKNGKDYTALIPFYPPISGREIADADTTPKDAKEPWHVDIEDIRLDGHFRYWVHRFRGEARGTLLADLDAVTRGGLFSIRVAQIELELDRHFSGESLELFQQGVITGDLEFAPFIPRENKGISILRYLLINADLGIDLNSLDLIKPFTRKFKHLKINGTGFIEGHLHMVEGKALAGTDLSVDVENLNVNLVSHDITGDGTVRIKVDQDPGNRLDLNVRFDNMAVEQVGGSKLLTGQGLVLNGSSDNELIRTGAEETTPEHSRFKDRLTRGELELLIPTARVADMSVFNHYLPPGVPLSFTRGTADLEADIRLKQADADGFLRLKATAMEALVDEQSIRADFSADISVVDGTLGEMILDIGGSELRLDNVRVIGASESFNEKNWAAKLMLTRAETTLTNPFRLKAEAGLHMTDSRPIVAMLGNQKNRPKWAKRMLTIEDVNGTVALDFVNPRLIISTASMDSDNIELGAKAVIDKDQRNGVIYVRYKKLDIIVKIADGKRNIDLLRARRKFDEYELPVEIK